MVELKSKQIELNTKEGNGRTESEDQRTMILFKKSPFKRRLKLFSKSLTICLRSWPIDEVRNIKRYRSVSS